jgi:hypothetical protein
VRAVKAVPGQLSLLAGCLDDRDRAVLAFARQHHLSGGLRRVQAELGMSDTRYFQLLLALLERAEVTDAEPELVAALRALLERRRRWR